MAFRAHYWSLSKVAAAIRPLFDLPVLPGCATAEEWDVIHTEERATVKRRIGLKLIKSFDLLQNAIYFIPDVWHNAVYYVWCRWTQTHMLRTTAEKGQWSDLTFRIPDALLTAVVDFIEQECFRMYVVWKDPDDGLFPPEVNKYMIQSYFGRKFFPVKVSSERRAEIAYKYIKWQTDNSDNVEHKAAWDEIIAAYKFAVGRYKTFDPWEESGYNLLPSEEGFMKSTDEQRACYKIIHQLEADHNAEINRHCMNIVKNRELMWV